MKKIINLFATALLLSNAAVVCAQAPPAAAPAAAPVAAKPAKADKVGVVVPPWQAAVVAGDMKTISSEDLKGKAYGIVFVNSSCSDCRREMDEVMQLKFNDKFTVLVAAVDRKMDRAVNVYRDEMKVSYPIMEDSKFIVAQGFGIAFTPATVIVGSDGKVEYWVAGYTDETLKATMAAFGKYGK